MSGNSQEAVDAAERFAAAHRALRADPTIQFRLKPAPPPPEPPAWLRAFQQWLTEVLRPVGRFFQWIGSFLPDAPYARIFLWTVLALVALALAWIVYERVRYGVWRLPRRAKRRDEPLAPEEMWAPDAAPARAWLQEADVLAADGRYAQAVHHLLIRSVEDIERRRPRVVRPSRTSRELLAETAIPASARDLFARIARLVERSLFGGRAVSADDWSAARAAYAEFALPGAWRA